jgi:hypothetical protein
MALYCKRRYRIIKGQAVRNQPEPAELTEFPSIGSGGESGVEGV